MDTDTIGLILLLIALVAAVRRGEMATARWPARYLTRQTAPP